MRFESHPNSGKRQRGSGSGRDHCRWSQRIDAAQRDCYYGPDFFPARWIVASAKVPGRVFFRARCSINRRPHLLDLVWIAPGSGTPHTGPSHISMMVMLCRLDGMAIVSQQGLELTTRTSLALVKHVGVGAHWCHPREEAESTFGAHKGGPCFRNAQRGGLLLTMLAAVGSSQAAQPQFEDGSVYRARWWAQLDSNQ